MPVERRVWRPNRQAGNDNIFYASKKPLSHSCQKGLTSLMFVELSVFSFRYVDAFLSYVYWVQLERVSIFLPARGQRVAHTKHTMTLENTCIWAQSTISKAIGCLAVLKQRKSNADFLQAKLSGFLRVNDRDNQTICMTLHVSRLQCLLCNTKLVTVKSFNRCGESYFGLLLNAEY